MKNKGKKLQRLTRAEEEVMQILWAIEKGFVKDIIELYPEPKPAYTTVSTIVRILEKKGFVLHRSYGKAHKYYPSVSKDEYRTYYLNSLMNNYFEGSFHQMASFLVKNERIDTRELQEIINLVKKGPEK